MKDNRKDFAWHIVDKRTKIEKIFAVLIIVSIVMIPMVTINYDLKSYLPDTSPSGIGLELMEDEFGFPGTAQIMIEDVSLYQAKQYKDMIQVVDGVDSVSWCDAYGYVYQAENFIDYDAIEDYYKDHNALMSVTFVGEDADPETGAAIVEIRSIFGDKGHMIGEAVANKSLQDTIFNEVKMMMGIVIVLILLILALATTSWLEPLIFMFVMGVAVILNKGTDLFIGEVSFLTFAISALLQLAVATDYAIFLFHSFARVKESGHNAEDAMVIAIREASKSILGSCLTTVVGFLALTLMEFSIGFDMGLSMAKGVLMCMFSVIVFMPTLILRTYAWAEKTSHRSFLPSFERTSKTLYRSRRITLVIILVMFIPMLFAQKITSYTFGMDDVASAEGSQYYQDEQLIRENFGSESMLAIIAPKSDLVTERNLARTLEDLPYVTNVLALATIVPEGIPIEMLPESITGKLHSDEYIRMLLYIASGKSEGDAVYAAYDEVESIMHEHYPEDSYIVGGIAATKDIEEILLRDYPHINRLSILGVYLVMVLTFRSLILPLLALIPIESAIIFNMAIPYFSGMDLMYLGMVMVSCILLGATVDYSILLCHTYMDQRLDHDRKEAGVTAIRKCIPTVLTSATIMAAVGLTTNIVSDLQILKDLGLLISRGAIIGMLFVMVLLPALLAIFDSIIQKEQAFRTTWKWKKKKKGTETERENINISEGEEL